MKNVLVFSCGAIPAIDINIALRGNKEYKVYGASSYDDHGLYIYENYIGGVPFISAPSFISNFNEILRRYQIDLIIPLHEDMILFFQEHRDEIAATIVSSCYDTALLCRYKSKTYQALAGFDFVPIVYMEKDVDAYPVFVKKDDDQGARHAYKVENEAELRLYARQPDMIICEYLPGEEVTVDCFTDRHGALRLVNPRAADRILAGIDVHARRLSHDEEIQSIAERINTRILFRGPWFFQIKRDQKGRFKLLEIATRFAGAFSLTRCMDLNTPLLALRDFDNKDVQFDYNDIPIEADKMFIGRYSIANAYSRVVVDGVECLCIGECVDTFLMMFIYQCLNKRKPITLLCSDTQMAMQQLEEKHIATSVFSTIFVSGNDNSTVFEKAVFISRDEQRRIEVREKYGICCYEPTAIEALLDWRG
jgi:hypothetical protein